MIVESNCTIAVATFCNWAKNVAPVFNQWVAKPCTPDGDVSRALRTVEVIAKNSDWFIALPAVVVIGRSKYFGIKPGFHIVVSVVSVVRKKFIAQREFILSRTTSCICRFFVLSICTGGFHKVISVLWIFSYDRYDRYNDMETRL